MPSMSSLWIPVSNLERSVKFYTEVLGMRQTLLVRAGDKDVDPALKDSFAHLETSNHAFLVVLVEKPSALPARGSIVPGLTTSDLEQTVARLKKKGVICVGGVIEFGDRKYTHFKDPDGHMFQVVEHTRAKRI